MSTLSTHVLDTAHGCPAAGVALVIESRNGVEVESVADCDGRCPELSSYDFPAGTYRIRFEVAAYFRAKGVVLPYPPFLDRVTIDFGIAEEGHYHVPLLVSPFGYSTYRGS